MDELSRVSDMRQTNSQRSAVRLQGSSDPYCQDKKIELPSSFCGTPVQDALAPNWICETAWLLWLEWCKARGHRVTFGRKCFHQCRRCLHVGIQVMQGYGPEHLEPAPDCVIAVTPFQRQSRSRKDPQQQLLYRSKPKSVQKEFIRGAAL